MLPELYLTAITLKKRYGHSLVFCLFDLVSVLLGFFVGVIILFVCFDSLRFFTSLFSFSCNQGEQILQQNFANYYIEKLFTE